MYTYHYHVPVVPVCFLENFFYLFLLFLEHFPVTTTLVKAHNTPPHRRAHQHYHTMPTPRKRKLRLKTTSPRPQPLRQHMTHVFSKPLPTTTAKAVCVLDLTTGRILAERSATLPLPVASLTKIVTALVTIRLAHRYTLPLTTTYFHVSNRASHIGGTTATLKEGDSLTIQDLLHGMLLPSGNDAATVLAENMGSRLLIEEGEIDERFNNVVLCERRFVKEMQLESTRVGNYNTGTLFFNPHGMDQHENDATTSLSDNENDANNIENTTTTTTTTTTIKTTTSKQPSIPSLYHCSTARDITKFAMAALQYPELVTVVNTKKYVCTVANTKRGKETATRTVEFHNTNKMLWKSQHAIGLKTGWTKEAGPCLCSIMKVPIVKHGGGGSESMGKERHFCKVLVLTLGSESRSERWVEHTRIHRWARRKLVSNNNTKTKINKQKGTGKRLFTPR